MANGAVFTKNGFNTMLNRAFKASPDYTAMSRFKIGTGTTTPTTADTDLETPITAWSGGSDYKDFVSGYPTFDEANQKVQTQGFIASTEANGNSITELGEFNTDGTPVLGSHIVITGITKTATIQVFFTTTYKRSV